MFPITVFLVSRKQTLKNMLDNLSDVFSSLFSILKILFSKNIFNLFIMFFNCLEN